MTKLIGLTGSAGSGKSTVAAILSRNGYTEFAFADPMKAATKAVFGIFDEQLERAKRSPDNFRGYNFTMREWLQKFGTEFGRNMDNEIWIKLMRARLEALFTLTPKAKVVVSDVRFENEAQLIKELDGEVWEIVRPGTIPNDHASEKGIPSRLIDRALFNASNLSELHRRVLYYVA